MGEFASFSKNESRSHTLMVASSRERSTKMLDRHQFSFIRNNDIGPEGGARIAAALEKNTSLKSHKLM